MRNHDELTLDQLGDGERQEVFEAFGADEDLQVFGRGLRMRLPTMLGGDGRRIRMVYSLAFSLPGAPVLFYGEEIGMGENRDIPGRMAVRSPMQWSDGRNGGFSEAPAGDVHRPVNSMPGFDPPAVNVAAQRRDEDSLLNWFERLIRRRRESPEIGHGTYRRLPTGDPAVLAHRCDWEGRAIVAVHNLAGRGARIDLSGFGEDEPRALEDLFGRRDAVAGPGATLDLEPYGFRWFALGGGVGAAENGNQTETEAVGRRQTMPTRKEDLPGTIARSPKKVQRTYAKTLDSAHEQYDSEERAHRTAFASVKHVAEKTGDHWELKDEPGPSDPQAEQSGRAARDRPKKTYGGVDVNGNTKDELYERARDLDVKGRSKMSKGELAEAIARRQ